MSGRRRPSPDRGGFTLIETLVAMLLGAVILMALAPPLVRVSHQQHVFRDQTAREGVLLQEAERYATLSFDDLPDSDDCAVVASGTFPHTRCVFVLVSSNANRKLAVVVTPLNPALAADTVVVQRSRPKGNPFDVGAPK